MVLSHIATMIPLCRASPSFNQDTHVHIVRARQRASDEDHSAAALASACRAYDDSSLTVSIAALTLTRRAPYHLPHVTSQPDCSLQ